MNIFITAPPAASTSSFRESVTDRLARTLARFSKRIARVDVTLTDENGPRGGVDQLCRLRVVVPGVGELAASATDENPWKAVDRAARRARRLVLTKLKRPISLRTKGRKEGVPEELTPEEEVDAHD